MIKAVASLLLLLVLGGLITATTGLVDGKSVERAMLSAFAGAQHADEIQESAAIDLSRAIVLNIAAPAEEVPEVAEETVAPQPTPFLLVVASLESASSARRHIGNDADLKYVDMGGKYRVYVDSFPTAQAASAALPSYQTKYPNVWVCRR